MTRALEFMETEEDLAYDEGVEAYSDDQAISENPYEEEDALAEAWEAGWVFKSREYEEAIEGGA